MSCHVNSLQSRSESSLFGPTARTSNRTNGPKGIFRSLERLAPGTALSSRVTRPTSRSSVPLLWL